MPRRARPAKRAPLPDPRYHNPTVTSVINRVMMDGKKRTSEGIVYGALQLLEQQVQRDAVTALEQAIKNVTPLLEVKPRRVGGATYQVPVEVGPNRGTTLAMRWLILAARERKGAPMRQKLAQELMDAARGQGAAVRRRENLHRMAEANQAFAHYRW